jgi:Mn-dependent DtxR family transcriptional regulator
MTEPRNNTPAWVQALLDKSLSATEYRVLMDIAWRQGDNADAWPSQEKIAEEMGLSRRGVQQTLERLEGKGWLRITWPNGPGRGREHTKRYALTIPEKAHAVPLLQSEKAHAVRVLDPEKAHGTAHKRRTGVRMNTIHRTLSIKKSARTHKPRQRKAARAVVYTPEFERVWDSYPRKVNKRQAFEVWTALAPSPELTERIIASIQEHIQSEQWSRSLAEDGGQYVPHLTTFLNQRRWEDVLPEPQPSELNLEGSTEEEIHAALRE